MTTALEQQFEVALAKLKDFRSIGTEELCMHIDGDLSHVLSEHLNGPDDATARGILHDVRLMVTALKNRS